MITTEETRGRVALRAHTGGCLIGIFYLSRSSPWGDGPWVANLWVHPEHRRQGVASALQAAAESLFVGQTIRGLAIPGDPGLSQGSLEAICLKMGYCVSERGQEGVLMEKTAPGR